MRWPFGTNLLHRVAFAMDDLTTPMEEHLTTPMEDGLTQPSTQQVIDPRRLGGSEFGLDEADIADVICILSPTSRAAIKIVENTANDNPKHILQDLSAMEYLPNSQPEPKTKPLSQQLDEAETFVLNRPGTARDIALRFSSSPKQIQHHFCFGRNPTLCDIILPIGPDSIKRISNLHFKIYITKDGIIMLEDMSTNGTMVDETLLKAKSRDKRIPKRKMLHPGAMITLMSPEPEEVIKFIVRVPDRTGYDEEFGEKLHDWLLRVEDEREYRGGFAVPTTPRHETTQVRRPVVTSVKTFGMHWNGGREYNVVDVLGKGAFATVYKLATTMNGEVLAAKELEKKRFMKNGQMDQKLDNEMKIMQDLTHPHIVQYIDTRDLDNYLYIIMEYVPYGNLSELLTRNESLPELAVMRMACQIFSALAYLHSKRITHRDIKPDNILISSEEPFDVKLSDFGLSKVVSNNDTFLKTFCGTLLFCAPEVFPHYSRNGNRKRRKPGEAKKNFHSYSQSVDIWSFGAVLWLALCGSPPFEGIMDNTGRAMFDRIMETPLDATPLRTHGVSELAIDLLLAMLNVDPSLRPTEIQCLYHPWLSGLAREIVPDIVQPDLKPIPEEDEEDEDFVARAQEFSQLSLNENDIKTGYRHPDPDYGSSDDDQDDYGENDPDGINPHQSKRIRREFFNPRYQRRDQSQFESSPEKFQNPAARARNVVGSFAPPPRVASRGQRWLFGEVGSHRALDNKANQVLVKDEDSSSPEFIDKSPKANQSIKRRSKTPLESQASPRKDPRGNKSAASLYGAESMVDKLTMNPTPSQSSPCDYTSDPRTPTPSPVNAAENGTTDSTPDEPTPKATKINFNRQINLPIKPSYFYDPWDKSTHTAEYAAKMGLDYDSAGDVTVPDSTSMPSTHFPSEGSEEGADDGDNNDDEDLAGGAVRSPRAVDSGFRVPAPRLGKLTTTDDSCKKLVLRLEKPVESWGRLPDNTIVYSDSSDTIIPKNAFTLWFFLPGNKELPKDSRDWTKAQDLQVQIHTNCRLGIRINNIKLDPPSDGRYQFGILYTGDVITVYDNRKGKVLKFVCEFAVGESAKRRPEGLDFQVLHSSPRR